jgi:Fe-S-cluster containining protein
MLIPLSRRQALARSRRLGYPDPPKWGKDYDLFTCKNWDEQTRLCGIYETRPNMCRDYPYEGRSCERGCGYALGQVDCERIAERKDAAFVWDTTEKGWRPRTNSKYVWDAERGVARARTP